MKIGFIGLGKMGSAMAANLLRAGHEVTVYNRTAERTRRLVDLGAVATTRVAEACTGSAVFTMLSDDAAVEQVVFGEDGILRHLAPGAVHISSSTVSVGLTERLGSAHAQAKQGFVAAPVFGRPAAAEARELFVIAAGPSSVLERVQPLFEAIGQRTFVVSDAPPAAAVVKLSGNFLIAAVIEGLGEAMAIAEKAGIDRRRYLEILTSTVFVAPIYKNYGGMIADRKVEPAGFPAALGEKDLRLLLAAGERLGVPTPLAGLLRDRFLTLLAHGGERLDWVAIGLLAARDAGIAGLPAV